VRNVKIQRLDVAVGVLLAVLLAWEAVDSDVQGPAGALLACALVAGLALVFRRVATVPAIAVSMLAVVALVTLADEGQEPQAPILAMLVAAYSAGAHTSRRGGAAGLGLVIAAIVIDEADNVVVLGPLCAGAFAAGRLWQGRERDARRMADLAEALERERVEEGRLAVAEERARIARELHDVVAHAMTTVVIEAGAERLHLGPEQRRTADVLHGIEQTSRAALVEMRRLLDVLRTADEDEAQLTPQPSLARLDELVEHVGRSGLAVDVRIEGRPVELSPGLDVSAYRIVQESLTNVLRHAEATAASVVVAYTGTALELTIADDGHGTPNGAGGHGIAGLRERVALFGGELDAGARDGGGFTVRARLPL
jgi:signal transduction histidine kinase